MMGYYYAIVFITVATMVTSIVHLFENQTLSRRVKNKLTFISALIMGGMPIVDRIIGVPVEEECHDILDTTIDWNADDWNADEN